LSPSARPSADQVIGRLGSNSLAIFFRHVLNTVLASLVAILLARHFGREEYGVLSMVFAYVSFFLIFQTLGVDTILAREASRRSNIEEILGAAAGLRVVLSTVSLLACWFCLPAIQPSARLARLIVLASLTFPLSFSPLYLIRNNVELRMGNPTLILGLWSVIYSVARLAMIWLGFSVEAFVVAFLVSDVVVFVISRTIGHREGLGFRIRFDASVARLLLKESWLIAIATLFLQVCLRVDQLMLYRMRGTEEVGLYAVAVRVVEFANFLPVVFLGSVFPILARLSTEDSGRLGSATLLSFRAMAWLAVPIAVFLALYADPLVPLVFGSDFAESAQMVRILALALVFTFANAVLFNRLFATGEQTSAAVLACVPAFLNVALNVPLIWRFGGTGAAIATLIAYGTVPALATLRPRSRDVGLMALGSLVRPGIAGGVSLVAAVIFHPNPFVGALLITIAYGGMLVALQELGGPELRTMRRALGGGLVRPVIHKTIESGGLSTTFRSSQ